MPLMGRIKKKNLKTKTQSEALSTDTVTESIDEKMISSTFSSPCL